ALLITNTTVVTVERVVLLHGQASGLGGGPASEHAGGGLYLHSGDAYLFHVDAQASQASLGGGYYNHEGNLYVVNCWADDNQADDGGGLYNNVGMTRVEGNSRFFNNSATANGGAFYNRNGQFELLNNVSRKIEWNSALLGGALYNESGDVLAVGNEIKANQATDGGAFYNQAGLLRLERNDILENVADGGKGGGLYSASDGDTQLDFGNRFYANVANQGGAIYGVGNSLTLHNTIVFLNEANQDGGGVYVTGGTPTIVHNTFYGNTAVGRGGGLYIASGSAPTVRNNIFDANSTENEGSAIYGAAGDLDYNDYYPDDVTLQVAGGVSVGTHNLNEWPAYVQPVDPANPGGADFHLSPYSPVVDQGDVGVSLDHDMDGDPRPINQAPDMGADELNECLVKLMRTGQIFGRIGLALDLSQDGDEIRVADGRCEETITIETDVLIQGAWSKDFTQHDPREYWSVVDAQEQGRVVRIANNTTVSIGYMSFMNGFVTTDGAGIYVEDADLELNYVDVFFNEAQGAGGGIYNAAGSTTDIYVTSVSLNTAGGQGGGIYNASGSTVTINGGGCSSNTAEGSGGGIYNHGSADFSLANYGISQNSSANVGGGLYNAAPDTTLINVRFHANDALDGGGLYNSGNNLTVLHPTFHENLASNRGGGIYNSGSGVTLNAGIIALNAASEGAGVYSDPNLSVSHTMQWDNVYTGVSSGDGNTYQNPRLNSIGRLTYFSPAIDALPEGASALTFDALANPRPLLCRKDMGYQEYAVGKRLLKWETIPEGTEVAPGTTHVYTYSVTNLNEQWLT
ncbi:MAG: choice-of-anchor Q domain-containing protein, partial [Anaerolineae bacterium]